MSVSPESEGNLEGSGIFTLSAKAHYEGYRVPVRADADESFCKQSQQFEIDR